MAVYAFDSSLVSDAASYETQVNADVISLHEDNISMDPHNGTSAAVPMAIISPRDIDNDVNGDNCNDTESDLFSSSFLSPLFYLINLIFPDHLLNENASSELEPTYRQEMSYYFLYSTPVSLAIQFLFIVTVFGCDSHAWSVSSR